MLRHENADVPNGHRVDGTALVRVVEDGADHDEDAERFQQQVPGVHHGEEHRGGGGLAHVYVLPCTRATGHVVRMEEKRMVRQTIKATFEEQRNEGGALIGELKWRGTWDRLEKTAGDRKEWRKEPKRLREEREHEWVTPLTREWSRGLSSSRGASTTV